MVCLLLDSKTLRLDSIPSCAASSWLPKPSSQDPSLHHISRDPFCSCAPKEPQQQMHTWILSFSSVSHDSFFSVFPPSLPPHPPMPTLIVPFLSPILSPVRVCFPVCVEVPSETEAVQGNPMKLRCISCMKREEVEATTVVEWFYRPEGGKDFLVCQTAASGLSFAGLCCCMPGSRQYGR